jgi:hypothetical protein
MSMVQGDFFTPYGGGETAFVIERPDKTHRAPSQAQRILRHLQAGHSLTPLEALERFGCFRLAARVHELRREGYAVLEETVTTAQGKRVARYFLP